jgi:hypothetical protein
MTMRLNKQARIHVLERLSLIRRTVKVPLEQDERRLEKQLRAAHAEGRAAFLAGCREEATPYSWSHPPELRRAWRDGWVDEWRARR